MSTIYTSIFLPGALLLAALFGGAHTASASQGGLFDLYAQNRQQGVPNYITEDFLLLGYSLVRRQAVTEMEQQEIKPRFAALLGALAMALAKKQAPSPITQANRHFLAILQALLTGKKNVLGDKLVQAEYQLILQATSVTVSPLWQQMLDYSQFKPRGRYNESEAMQGYFRAMRYASGVLFAVQPSRATSVSKATAKKMTAQARQLAALMQKDITLNTLRAELEGLLSWQFGPNEDLHDQDLSKAEDLLSFAKKEGRQPHILGGVVNLAKLEDGLQARDVLTGWRLLPARYSADSAAFQRLVYPQTGVYRPVPCPQKNCLTPFGLSVIGGQAVKAYPLGLELLAALGSHAAQQRLAITQESHFAGYSQAVAEVAALLGNSQGLGREQLLFMQQALRAEHSDPERRLNSVLSFWTWQRYLNLLYSKQSYTPVGKSLNLSPARPGAMLAATTSLYLALDRLVEAHKQQKTSPLWARFDALLEQVIVLSFTLQQGNTLNVLEERFLNNFDLSLKALVGITDQPIVVDVHSNPAEGMVVEEGLAWAKEVAQGKARGALFVHREFKHAMQDRLTDEAWQAILAAQMKQ